MAPWVIPAISAASSAFGLIAGNNRQKNIDEAAQIAAIEYGYGQQAAQAAHARQMALYNHIFSNELITSDPSFQRRRIEAAGFNPALMYNGSQGGMGVSMPQASGGAPGVHADRVSPQISNAEILDKIATQALNFSMLKAQKENVEAQTEQIQAETDKTKYETSDVLPSEVELTFEHIKDAQVRREGMRLDNEMAEIRKYIANVTKEDEILSVKYEVKNAARQADLTLQEIIRAKQENHITRETMEARIDYVYEQLGNLIKDTILKEAEISLTEEREKLTEAEKWQIYDAIGVIWDQEIEDRKHLTIRGQNLNAATGLARLAGDIMLGLGLRRFMRPRTMKGKTESVFKGSKMSTKTTKYDYD